MIRHLLQNFQRVLSIHPSTVVQAHTPARLLQRALYHSEINTAAPKTETHDEKISVPENETETETAATLASDTDYIVPYSKDNEKITTAGALIQALRTRFRLTPVDVQAIINDEAVHRSLKERPVVRTLDLLCENGLDKKTFLDYPWLLTLDRHRLQTKLNLIKMLHVRDINHFVPFLRLSISRLRHMVQSLKREEESIPQGNRLYYISEQLKLEPSMIAKYLCKRLFVMEMPFEMLEQNLQHMLNYNVSPLNILKDLWAFRYTPKSVEMRLERAKRAKKEKIMPWMVRCPEPILQRSLKLSLDELKVLGDKSSVVEYVANRLQYSIEETNAIMAKHPQVKRVRVTKIKEVLDYLLNEEGFLPYEIAQVPRILCHGLETTKQRLGELKSLGCRPSSLVIVCRSKREYEKFVKAWVAKRGTDANAKNTEQQLPLTDSQK